MFLDGLGDLLGHAFLDLNAARENIYDARNLREPDDSAVGDVSHMALAVKGKEMMLAEREEIDVFDDDHLVVFFLEGGALDGFLGVFVVALREKAEGLRHALGGADQAFPLRVFAEGDEEVFYERLNGRDVLFAPRHIATLF